MRSLHDLINVKHKKSSTSVKKDPFVDAILPSLVSSGGCTTTLVEMNELTYKRRLISQYLGNFHEEVMSIMNECEGQVMLPGSSNHRLDLVSHTKKIVAEVQNAAHTKSGDGTKKIREYLHSAVKKYPGYKGYHVVINRSIHKPVELKKHGENIYHVSGKYFYRLLTGDTLFMEKLAVIVKKIVSSYDTYEDFVDEYTFYSL